MNPNNLLCAATGPVMMIAVGVLFAVDHFGRYSILTTWPLLIIVFGLLKLGQRASAPGGDSQ